MRLAILALDGVFDTGLTKENLHTFDLLPIGPLLPLGFLIKQFALNRFF
jgi:hypothetical protein